MNRYDKKSLLVQYKGGKCCDCGNTFPLCCFDFDHRDPDQKMFSISEHYGWTMEELIPEADKCDLVCANCHRIRTTHNPKIGAKVAAAQRGKKQGPRTQEQKDRMSAARKGGIPWNKGKTGLQIGWNKGLRYTLGPRKSEELCS
jgi:hypothetical protein